MISTVDSRPTKTERPSATDPLLRLRGYGKGTWDSEGGGDAFVRRERQDGDQEEDAAPPAKRCLMDPEVVWSRLKEFENEEFKTVRGLPVSFQVDGRGLWFFRDGRRIEKRLSFGQFAVALGRCPIERTTEIADLFDPSYLLAILRDARIRRGDW